jgi:hypothetical protein
MARSTVRANPSARIEGNVIALPLDGLAPDRITRYNAESWLSGRLPYNFEEPRTTLAEMAALAGTNAPQTNIDGAPVADVTLPGSPPALALFLAGAASLLALGAQRRRWHQTGR